MATVTELRERLVTVFPPPQAGMLADVLHGVREAQVTREDFHELKGVVQDLAETVQDLAGSVQELSGAQACTERRVDKLAEAQGRTEQRVGELALAQVRTERRVEELALAQARLTEAQQDTERALADLARQVGGLSETVGANLEDLACEIVPELLEKHWGLTVTSAGPEELRTNGTEYPFDLVVRGTIADRPVVVLGEVKSNLSARQAERFLRLVELVRPGLAGEGEVRAVCFGYRAERAARELLKARGVGLVFSRGVMV